MGRYIVLLLLTSNEKLSIFYRQNTRLKHMMNIWTHMLKEL